MTNANCICALVVVLLLLGAAALIWIIFSRRQPPAPPCSGVAPVPGTYHGSVTVFGRTIAVTAILSANNAFRFVLPPSIDCSDNTYSFNPRTCAITLSLGSCLRQALAEAKLTIDSVDYLSAQDIIQLKATANTGIIPISATIALRRQP